ncbi:MAG: cobalamin-dependent protein [Desulfovibrionaceae bacterium]|nr:cobalamin-dependent protein [Desulfovibrionaceae bacterium]
MIKIVLINAFEPSYLGTRCLASFVRQYGFETHNILLGNHRFIAIENPAGEVDRSRLYVDGAVYEHYCYSNPLTEADFQRLEEVLREERPDILGFSARTKNNHLVPLLIPIFKRAAPRALLVAGGYGPTLEPAVYLDGGFDVVVRGDGEESLLQLARCVESKDFDSITHVPNTFWSAQRGGSRNPLCDQKKDLSEYPPPLIGNALFSYINDGTLRRNYDPMASGTGYVTYFGRGCIGKCSYCSGGQWSTLYRDEGKKAYKRRNRSMESVIDELRSLPPNIKLIEFADEYWSLTTQRCREFFELYKKYVHVPFWAYLDYEQMVTNPDLFDLVLDAGLYKTGVGFQTGSGEFAKTYYNRKQDYEILLAYTDLLFKNKVYVNPQFIGGNCYETMDVFFQTIELAKKLPFSIESPFFCRIQTSQLQVYPKSPLRELAPKVIQEPMPAKEWYYRAILLELSRIVPEDQFNNIMKIKRYRNRPNELQRFYRILLFNLQYEHFKKLIEEQKDKKWIYYGADSAYHRNKDFFSELRPEMIMIDKDSNTGEKTIDNIPVITPEEFFTSHKPDEYQFMIFIPSEFSCIAAKELLRTYKVPYDNIHSCTSDHMSPFAADLIEQYYDPAF